MSAIGTLLLLLITGSHQPVSDVGPRLTREAQRLAGMSARELAAWSH